MSRRPLSPLPCRDFSEQGQETRLFGQWKRLANQADLVVEVGERPQVDIERELAQVAIIKGGLSEYQE